MKSLLPLLLLLTLVPSSYSLWKVHPDSTAHPNAISDIEYIVNNFYQELNQTTIEVKELQKDSAPLFLSAFTTPDQFGLPPLERHYTINVNSILYDTYLGCPEEAIFAILVHELSHIDFYVYLSNIDKLMTFVRKFYNPNDSTYKAEWERWTDKKVLYRDVRHPQYDLGEGLQTFRTWVYNLLVLNEDYLDDKVQNYLSPEEIRTWLDEHTDPNEPTEVFDEEIEALP